MFKSALFLKWFNLAAPQIQKPEATPDFRVKTTFGVSITVLFPLVPLCINHFYQGRYLLGLGSLAIVALFAFLAWNCHRDRYNPLITFIALVPVITLFLAYTFHKMGMIAAFWCYPAVLSFYFMLRERQAWIANVVFHVAILPQAWITLAAPHALRLTITLIAVSAFSAIFVRIITSQQKKLELRVATDPLTGLLNRTLLNSTLEHAVLQNNRMDTPMTLVALDLDFFKEINDNLGHDAGDKVLHGIGKILRERIRRSDKIFRLGGEEFLALLYDTDLKLGLQLAEELRHTIESQPVLPDHPVTVSIGVATLETHENWDDWMKRCDKNLYRAKQDGRNRVIA